MWYTPHILAMSAILSPLVTIASPLWLPYLNIMYFNLLYYLWLLFSITVGQWRFGSSSNLWVISWSNPLCLHLQAIRVVSHSWVNRALIRQINMLDLFQQGLTTCFHRGEEECFSWCWRNESKSKYKYSYIPRGSKLWFSRGNILWWGSYCMSDHHIWWTYIDEWWQSNRCSVSVCTKFSRSFSPQHVQPQVQEKVFQLLVFL